jgi:hypothetical protein
LIAARDHDVCPLRATTPLLEVIEELTRAASVPLIRADRVLDRRDLARRPLPDGLCDSNRFEDHIHPTVTGHQEIAEALASAVLAEFGVTAPETYEADYRVAATKHLGQLDEAYFIRGEQRLQGLLNWAKGRAGRLSIEPLPEATP